MDTAEPLAPKPKRAWLIGTPLVSLAMAVLIVVLWTPTIGMTSEQWVGLHYDFALVPSRFFAEPGSMHAYPNILAQGFSLVTLSLLHTDMVELIFSAFTIWWSGSIVARALGPGLTNAGKWMLLYIVSTAAASISFLVFSADANTFQLVGAWGGVWGLIGASALIDRENHVLSPLSRTFLLRTLIFVLCNLAAVYGAPYLGIHFLIFPAVHAGGYVAGAAMMLILGWKIRARSAA